MMDLLTSFYLWVLSSMGVSVAPCSGANGVSCPEPSAPVISEPVRQDRDPRDHINNGV